MRCMRVALVSPYSWTYPGGVTRHIEALAGELLAAGPRRARARAVRPRRPPHRLAAPRRAAAAARRAPEWLVPLGADDRLAVERRRLEPRGDAVGRSRRCGASCAPGGSTSSTCTSRSRRSIGWDALTSADAPLVGTFHCYSESGPPHAVAALMGARRKLNRLAVRIAVSEAAAWTGRRFYGGELPDRARTASRCPAGGAPAPRLRAPGEPLEIVFVGQAVERKGLPILLRAFEALRAHVPARLTIVGASESEVAPLLVERAGRDRARPRVRRREAAPRSSAPTCSPRRRSAASRSAWC